jgi:hypothetical protein
MSALARLLEVAGITRPTGTREGLAPLPPGVAVDPVLAPMGHPYRVERLVRRLEVGELERAERMVRPADRAAS